MLLEPCAEEAVFFPTRTRILIDNFASLQSWDGVLNVHQVGFQGGVGIVGNRDIVWIRSSGYWLRDALGIGHQPPEFTKTDSRIYLITKAILVVRFSVEIRRPLPQIIT